MSRMIDLIRTSAVPASLVQAAARGALSLPPGEMIEILVHLAVHNKVFGQQARLTLAGWDEKSSREAASDPNTSKEVLDYWIAAENLRPVLLPFLLENPSVSEQALVVLGFTGSREVVEVFLKSSRAQKSSTIRQALASNANLSTSEETAAQDYSGPTESPISSSSPVENSTDDILSQVALPETGSGDEVLDAEVMAYLVEHQTEISSEGDKPFQPIGGIYDELAHGSEEPLEEAPPAVSASTAVASTGAAVAPKKAPALKKTFLSAGEERGSALQKISKLDIKGRIQLAMKGTKEERSLLVRDGTKLVALAVLDSPKISDGEVEKIASQKNVLEAVLRAIPMKRKFAKNYIIIRNLVSNPRTPLDVSLGLMKNILVNDLRNLAANKDVSDTVRKLAQKMFKQKADPTKKSTG